MGIYINPTNGQTKEEWLKEHATDPKEPLMRACEDINYQSVKEAGYLPVCLIDNGGFTAAGVAYNEDELKVFITRNGGRPTTWFLVPIEKLNDPSSGIRGPMSEWF